MKKFGCAILWLCLLAGYSFVHAEPGAEKQGILQLPEGFSLKVVPEGRSKKTVEPDNGKAVLDYGKYRVEYWEYQKQDAHGKQWKIRGYPNESIEFQITDQPVSLEIKPEPISGIVKVAASDDYRFLLKCQGPANERYYLYCEGQQVEAPKLEITNADKSFNVTLPSKYG